MSKKKAGKRSEATASIAPSTITADELKSRIVKAVDDAISGQQRAVRMNGGSYTRSDSSGTYTRPDRTLTRI